MAVKVGVGVGGEGAVRASAKTPKATAPIDDVKTRAFKTAAKRDRVGAGGATGQSGGVGGTLRMAGPYA